MRGIVTRSGQQVTAIVWAGGKGENEEIGSGKESRRAVIINGESGEQPKDAPVRRGNLKEYNKSYIEKRQELREKEGDTFQDDEFFDRTLEKKEELNL